MGDRTEEGSLTELDKDWFSRAYEDGVGYVKAFIYSKCRCHETASEVTQFAWSRAWEKREQLTDRRKLKYWVATIALNRLRSHKRNEWRDAGPEGLPYIANKDPMIDDQILFDQLISRLPRRFSRTLQAVLSEGTIIEVGNLLGVTENAAKLRKFRMVEELRIIAQVRTTVAPVTEVKEVVPPKPAPQKRRIPGVRPPQPPVVQDWRKQKRKPRNSVCTNVIGQLVQDPNSKFTLLRTAGNPIGRYKKTAREMGVELIFREEGKKVHARAVVMEPFHEEIYKLLLEPRSFAELSPLASRLNIDVSNELRRLSEYGLVALGKDKLWWATDKWRKQHE